MVETARTILSRSQEDYLKALYLLQGDRRPVPTGELAHRLGISPPSVSEMVGRLSAQGLVTQDRYRGQQLTPNGRHVALELVRHHRLLEMFLVQVLGYSWDEVHDEAERLEHVISEKMEDRIFELLGRPNLDPHGHAIPTRGGAIGPTPDRPLSECLKGEHVVVRVVSDEDPARLRELERRGLMPGARLHITAATVYDSPIEARINRRPVTIPVGLARDVFVEKAV